VHNADGAIQAVAGELVDEDVDEDEEEEDDNLAEMEQGDFIGPSRPPVDRHS
jgi:hypothetical protein